MRQVLAVKSGVMDQHDTSAKCPLCEQSATAISSFLSQQPEQFDLVPMELLSGKMLYERADEVNGHDLFSGRYLAENSQCSTCTALADSIIHRTFQRGSEPVPTLRLSKLTLNGPMCTTGCFMLEIEITGESYQLRIVPFVFCQLIETSSIAHQSRHDSKLGANLRFSARWAMSHILK
ncbi:hypothetical protein K504DRAFT_532607 [Pleomassaria siparia CBS 279.74]|uniref:Uncharacterized protein n=1 Tax=Pleomassaria siparia CBS 279.74 TaxID=1314801 RepID=A0A6G1KDD4_9PLEO|nr:hypothetical protein K504DRAFT_532607 [Pleomassaria siparia CBS 279.74]